jgi:CRP/FNR family transcriptional regulator, dissimilatory nitrate respiration regulator
MTCLTQEIRLAALANVLRSSRLFSGISHGEADAVAAFTSVKRVDKGEYLFHEGQASKGFYIVQRGGISIQRSNAAGKTQVMHVFRPGESFAEGSLAHEKGYPADALAVEDSQVLLVRKEEMLALLRRQPELALRVLGQMNDRLRLLVAQLEDMTSKSLETRLANWLLKCCPDRQDDKPARIELTIAKGVLASELGSSSENFSRMLATFRKAHLIEVKGRVVTVVDPARLDALLRRNLGDPPEAVHHGP